VVELLLEDLGLIPGTTKRKGEKKKDDQGGFVFYI
jgi:hypothetical protein